jgi:hypothetical protein
VLLGALKAFAAFYANHDLDVFEEHFDQINFDKIDEWNVEEVWNNDVTHCKPSLSLSFAPVGSSTIGIPC